MNRVKTVIIGLTLLSSFAWAASAQLNVIVNVQSVFELSIDRHTVEIPSIRPGQVITDIPDNEGVKVSVRSNNGNPWYLKIGNLTELTDGTHVIPNSNFFWYGYPARAARGIWYGKGTEPFSIDPVLVYSADSSEYNNYPDGTDLFFKFKLSVPRKQNSGIYRSIVAFTVTE